MADSAVASGNDGPEGETPTQRQARLRREKRQKKMTDQGEDRLARIKALNGGVAPPAEVLGGPQATAHADDPEEVDISQNTSGFGTPSARQPHIDAKENPLAAAMLQMQNEQARNEKLQGAHGSSEDDPMVRMMEQMMGLMGGANPQDPNAPPPDLPPMLKAMMGGAAGAAQDGPLPTKSSVYLWRIVHAVFALSLATYIALMSTFNGSSLSRTQSVYTEDERSGFGRKVLLIFCTVELVLQSSRYFLEKGQLQGTGIVAQVLNSGFIPEPWAGYIRSAGRYVGIAKTIFADLMVVVFVLGALAWWRGAVVHSPGSTSKVQTSVTAT